MSFLDRIRNAFKQEETLEEVELSLEEIISKLGSKAKEQDSGIIEQAYEKTEEILREIKHLSQLIDRLEKLEPDGILPGPKAVKERFCTATKNQLASIEKPANNMDEIKEFMDNTYNIMQNLGSLTERQAMHIRFFFKEEFKPIGKKTKEISEMTHETREIIRGKGYSESYTQIIDLHEKTKELDRTIKNKSNRATTISDDIERLRSESEELARNISKIDTEDFKQYSKEIYTLEEKINSIKQETSSFLSIEKLLRKLIHEKKIKNELLDLYTESPVEALLCDEELKINQFIEQALELCNKGSIEVDQKKIDKANEILKNNDYLKNQKKELLELIKQRDQKKEHMDSIIIPKIEKKKEIEHEKSRIEFDIKKLQESKEAIPREIEEMEKQKSFLNQKIADIASDAMGMTVKIKSL